MSDASSSAGALPAIEPRDGPSWFLRDVDGHFSHKRLIAFVFVATWIVLVSLDTAGLPVKPELMSALSLMITGFGGLSVAERFQPGGR